MVIQNYYLNSNFWAFQRLIHHRASYFITQNCNFLKINLIATPRPKIVT